MMEKRSDERVKAPPDSFLCRRDGKACPQMTRRFELKGLLFTAFPPLEAEESGNTPVENQKEEKNSFPQRVYSAFIM